MIAIGGGIIVYIIIKAIEGGVSYTYNEVKTPNGTLVADTEIAIESLDGSTR